MMIIFALLCLLTTNHKELTARTSGLITNFSTKDNTQMNLIKNDSLPEIAETPITVEALPPLLKKTIGNQKAAGKSLWSEIKCGSKAIYHQFTEISGESKKYNAKGELLWVALHCYQPQCYNDTMRKLADAATHKPGIIVEDASTKYKYLGYTLISGSLPREGDNGNATITYIDASRNTVQAPNIMLLNKIFNDPSNFN